MVQKPKYVVIGGGTGSFAVLSGLKSEPIDLSALVSMADDGGSTGALRDELDVLPAGDVRQCLVALSSAPQQLRNLFNYRFEEGGLAGHSFGNLFLSAVEKMTDNFGEAVRLSSEVLRIQGRVIPITLDNVRLALELADRTIIHGQRKIDDTTFNDTTPHPRIFLEPTAHINPEADAAIRRADVIVIAPGDLYTSLAPLLVVEGVADALRASKARVIYVCNLVIKPGHTTGMTVADHAAEIERFAGAPVIDCVLYNTAQPPPAVLEKYNKAGGLLVDPQASQLRESHYTATGMELVDREAPIMSPADVLATTGHRSYIRHDSQALAKAIMSLSNSH